VVTFDRNGSYPSTHRGQGSDMGFTGGLMGYFPDSPELRDAEALAKAQGVEITFAEAELGAQHPNEARIDVYGSKDSPKLSVLTFSTGGGTFQLVEMDGFQIFFEGQRKKFYLACRAGEGEREVEQTLCALGACYQKRLPDASRVTFHTIPEPGCVLFEIEAMSLRDPESLLALGVRSDVFYIRTADVLVPIPICLEPEPHFRTAAEALELAEKTGVSMADLALDYECGISGVGRGAVRDGMAYVLKVMRTAMTAPAPEDAAVNGVMQQHADQMATQLKTKPLVDAGVLNRCMVASTAVMENNNAHRIIVAAPTAGSSGVIPAAVVSVGEQMGLDDNKIVDGLLAAGLVGSFIANYATFGAEVAGCQAEVGSASCMAAAGIVQMMGGSVVEGFRAASIAMQSFLGLICDPVGGITEIPCIARNASGAAVAVMAANLALCGFDPMVPLDETVRVMLEVGQALPDELRCTCGGGLCVTPTGCKLGEIIREKSF